MPSLADQISRLRHDLTALTDRAHLTALIDRFAAGLDHPDPDACDENWYRALFTEDVHLDLPNGDHHGVAGLPGFFHGPKAAWARTHHLVTNHHLDLDGDRASGQASAHATHVPHDGGPLFTGGAHYHFTARRTPAGWRIDHLAVAIIWSTTGPR
ncbi:nuclear transport factor 2 family protein [Streptomyces sp. ISL-11]|uniref:nuclear transport factor 2 family protein n=1 Tax=Streptomyces sp. ISL-11 TaxID=2819174 RepID=UPI001BE87469|nr:nuclear transport factor 2 family protein [Streptomyces sp. ISL-11]MBT2387157.1 nuclear transport factor 2 family protein [Streptomyces sp. ISL-11]